MAQDIRKMMQQDPDRGGKLPEGHEARFEKKLQEAFGEKKKKRSHFLWMKIAAAVVIFLGLGYWYMNLDTSGTIGDGPEIVDTPQEDAVEEPGITLGDLSPELKKVQDFYENGILVQLSSLEDDNDNKELIDGYKKRLAELDEEYKRLNEQLNEIGPTEATINALVDNLKLRLELLFKLKNKLKELKQLENEQFKEEIG
ncbi:hypothetical protein POV27_19545 [Aureisphaera galaxeae]|uniref:hypothetical protein n=1 Tax=Aureisphaera galaxeae TaxID=1538023 RepID=UPI0023502CAA|nr:hypothetical protein [Aureisphaera galaxeae]MDC8006257.1 hypothetical protein [Aureisphaera galaxeae]